MMANATPTIHNAARLGEIAKTVLMPGDPVRARFIAEHFFTDAKLVSDVRNICAYTGSWRGAPVSVMASGMGTSSMSIYSRELYAFYGVEAIIRVGSAGGLAGGLTLGDIVIAQSASTDSSYPALVGFYGTYAPTASFALLDEAVRVCRARSFSFAVGPVFSGEAFYYDDAVFEAMGRMGMLAVEMETAALYTNAAVAGKGAVPMHRIGHDVHRRKNAPPRSERKTLPT